MPRAKQKSVGAKRRGKKATSANVDNPMLASEAETTMMEAACAVAFVEEDMSIAASPSDAHGEASPSLMLPDCLDSAAAITIKEMLLSERGKAIAVDASQVRRVGVQSLQVLVAAARAWQHDGLRYRLENPSSEFLETIALIGLPHQDLLLEGHQ